MKYTFKKKHKFHSVEYIGANEDDELYKGIIVFMITDFKNTVPLAIKACPKATVNGEWLSLEILKCTVQVINTGFFLLGLLFQPI